MSKNWWGILIALLLVNLIWSMALFINFSSRSRKSSTKGDSSLAYAESPTYKLSVAVDAADRYSAAETRAAVNRICLKYFGRFTVTESMQYSPSEGTVIVYTFSNGSDDKLGEMMHAIAEEIGITDMTLEKYTSCKRVYQK